MRPQRKPRACALWRGLAAALLLAAMAGGGVPAMAHEAEHDRELDFSKAPADTLAWGLLAKVGLKRVDGKLARNFLPPVRALAGKQLTLYGYATAVDDHQDPHSLFLLSSQPIACRGCATPVEPEGVVEVKLARATDLLRRLRQSDVMAVRGKLVLVEEDGDKVLYRLRDAVIVEPRREHRAHGGTPAAKAR